MLCQVSIPDRFNYELYACNAVSTLSGVIGRLLIRTPIAL